GERVLWGAGACLGRRVEFDRGLALGGGPGAVLDGEGGRQILRVSADGVTVRGLTLGNVGRSFVEDRAAITVQDASWCTISDNRIEDAFFGIYLANAGWCVIERNTHVSGERRETSSGNGIHL